MQGDRGLDDVVDVAPIDQVEEAITLEHVDHLWLHPGEMQVDAMVDAGAGDSHQDVGTFGVDEVDTLHAQDHTIDSCRLLDADLPETIRERIGVDEEETAVEAKDLEPGDRLDVLVTVEVVGSASVPGLAAQLRDVGQRRYGDQARSSRSRRR